MREFQIQEKNCKLVQKRSSRQKMLPTTVESVNLVQLLWWQSGNMFGKCNKKKKLLRLFIQKDFIKLTTPPSSAFPTQGMSRLRWGSWGDVHSNGTLKTEQEVAHNPTHGPVTRAETLGGILCSHSKRLFFSVIFTERWVCPQSLGPRCQTGPGSRPRSRPWSSEKTRPS